MMQIAKLFSALFLATTCALALALILNSTPVIASGEATNSPAKLTSELTSATSATAEALLRDSKCAGCHALKFATADDKTGNAIYRRKNRSVKSYAGLIVQVARCDTELNLQVFEDDQLLISQYLNARFYHFSVPKIELKK